MIPTTIFSPIEYGLCGLSEEQAFKKYSKEEVYFLNKITIFHSLFTPLE
jgi:hypothetical protein